VNAYFAELKSHFQELEKREQIALTALSAFLVGVVLYLGVLTPVNEFVAGSRLDFERHHKLYEYLDSTSAQAKQASKSGGKTKASGQSLLTSISRSTQSIGIRPSRMQPEGSDAVSVWFDSVAFSQLMLWVERLESQHSIVVRQITIDRKDQPGQVSARLLLRN
jgi:general secretion pathway protein M